MTEDRVFFFYTTQATLAPREVTHICVDENVEKIQRSAFQNRDALVQAILPEGLKVIGDEAFRYCQKIQHVSIPSTVSVLGYGLFLNCSSLVSVNLFEGLREIGTVAFANCKNLKKINIPSTTEVIGACAFSCCTSLRHVPMEEGVRVIGEQAFEHCGNLLKVEIPSTVHTIEAYAFCECVSLVRVSLRDGLEFIGQTAFAGCRSLSNMTIPHTTKAIGFRAFTGCFGLLGVEIPNERTLELDHEIFRGCTNLVNVSISSTASPCDLFVECTLLHKVHVDQGVLLKRYEDLPIHEVCYHSSRSTLDDLKAQLTSSAISECDTYDAFGMSPLHLIATSDELRSDMLEVLLEHYSPDIISHKDFNGKTMVDYLLMRNTTAACALVQMVLKSATLKIVSGWGLERRKLKTLFQHEQSVFWLSNVWIRKIRTILTLLLPHYQTEVVSFMELVLWKMKIKVVEKSGRYVDRESCRVLCGADDVISNVTEFLWTNGSKDAPQEILPQSYCLISMK